MSGANVVAVLCQLVGRRRTLSQWFKIGFAERHTVPALRWGQEQFEFTCEQYIRT